jgi:hypothetical protein
MDIWKNIICNMLVSIAHTLANENFVCKSAIAMHFRGHQKLIQAILMMVFLVHSQSQKDRVAELLDICC